MEMLDPGEKLEDRLAGPCPPDLAFPLRESGETVFNMGRKPRTEHSDILLDQGVRKRILRKWRLRQGDNGDIAL